MKIGILGHDRPSILSALERSMYEDVIIVTPEADPFGIIPFTITNPHPLAPYPDDQVGDNFICKGKHQYRQVKGTNDWVCECGRKTTD